MKRGIGARVEFVKTIWNRFNRILIRPRNPHEQ